MRTHPRGCGAILLAAAVGLACFWPMSSEAHARLVRSTPQKGEQSAKAPVKIELWFNELLDEGFHSIEVYPARQASDKHRTSLAKGKAAVDPKDRTHLTIELEALKPGEYVVEWRVLSRDGHSAPGRFSFKVNETK